MHHPRAMNVGARPTGLVERIAGWLNLIPRPLVDTQIAFNAARAIMAGSTLGIFDALARGPATAEEVAKICVTDPPATASLLSCLVALEYLRWRGGRFENTKMAAKWLVSSSPVSVADKLRFQQFEWNWMAKLEEFVRTGKALDLHASQDAAVWTSYMDAMRALSVSMAPAVAKGVKLPSGATAMLDIGGSHGLHSAAFLRRHPQLKATILELPQAIARASELGAREGLGDRLVYRAGDALSDDLGERVFDFVLISNVVHHFSDGQNRQLAAKVARALKPGGVYAISEFERGEKPGEGGAVAAASGLYFALTSTSGAWSVEEMQSWQRDAGLGVGKAIRYVEVPGIVTVVATARG